MSDPNPPSETNIESPPLPEVHEAAPAVLETPTEVVSTRIHYASPPPPYTAVKSAPVENAQLLGNSITITIKCPSCLGFLANDGLKSAAPVVTLALSALELLLLLVGYTYYRGMDGKATCYTAVIVALIASIMVVLKPVKVSESAVYAPFAEFAGMSIATTMHVCNIAVSFYMAGASYVVWYYVVNGILSIFTAAISGSYVLKTLLASRQETRDANLLLPVSPAGADHRAMYWKECMLLAFIGTVVLIDGDRGQWVMFGFVLWTLIVSTVFAYPSRLVPKELVRFVDVAHLELAFAASTVAIGLLDTVYSSFLVGHGWMSGSFKTEIIVSVLLMACAAQTIVHIIRHVSVAHYAEVPVAAGNLARNMTAAQDGKKPALSPLV